MEFHLPHILSFLALALVVSHAALPPERYWNSVLPNTPMPKSVRDLLHPNLAEDKSTSVAVGKGGVNVNDGVKKHYGNRHYGEGTPTSIDVIDGVKKHYGNRHYGKGTPTSIDVSDAVKRSYGNRHYGKGTPTTTDVYHYSKGTPTSIHDDPKVAIFFLEKDMQPGKMMNLLFTENAKKATFLPRQVADSIPFSSNKLPEIYGKFSVKPGSMEAEAMKDTIEECESPGIKGEEKYCATSLESMIDFSTSKLGKNVQAISTEVENQTQIQKYTIKTGAKEMAGDKSVVCHKENYAYAVFYCHAIQATRAYKVPLEGADGTKAKAVAVCHTDTSEWNPNHMSFQMLNVKPGTVPICHFLQPDTVVWVQN